VAVWITVELTKALLGSVSANAEKENVMNKKPLISRREFLSLMVAGGFNLTAANTLLSLPGVQSTQTDIDMAVARGSNSTTPTALVEAAIAALGGIEVFVKPGDDVIIKPNILTADYSYEYAGYTNPEVVGAITALCVGAGAGRVRMMDYPASGAGEREYARSGIGEAVISAGGETEVMSPINLWC